MSLVGTRPPTVDEWEQYELHHRSRMSIKPGITGMWQASGRSDITDFEEVVRLDADISKIQRMKKIVFRMMKMHFMPGILFAVRIRQKQNKKKENNFYV